MQLPSCSSREARAGVDPNFGIFGELLVLLWQYITKERLIRFTLFIWAAVQ